MYTSGVSFIKIAENKKVAEMWRIGACASFTTNVRTKRKEMKEKEKTCAFLRILSSMLRLLSFFRHGNR